VAVLLATPTTDWSFAVLSSTEIRDLIFLLRKLVVHGDQQERLIELEAKLQAQLLKQRQAA
jgi:hypothetical protein